MKHFIAGHEHEMTGKWLIYLGPSIVTWINIVKPRDEYGHWGGHGMFLNNRDVRIKRVEFRENVTGFFSQDKANCPQSWCVQLSDGCPLLKAGFECTNISEQLLHGPLGQIAAREIRIMALSSAEAPASYPNKNSNNRKNSKREGDDGKREKASLFPLPIVPRALSFPFSQPPCDVKRPVQRKEDQNHQYRITFEIEGEADQDSHP